MSIAFVLSGVSSVRAQWEMIDIQSKAPMRAVHTLTPTLCWIGSSGGNILKTKDGGKTWTTYHLPDSDSLDFRDIHAFSSEVALAMSAGLSQDGKARIYRTEDGGQHWELVYSTTQPDVFLDGLSFWNKKRGICQGDPVNGRFFILLTQDGGKTWTELPEASRPVAQDHEACFAASGTSLITYGKGMAFFGTGGAKQARIMRSLDYGTSWEAITTALPAGPSSGVFGLHFSSAKQGIAVGGDYKQTDEEAPNVLTTSDGGATWSLQKATVPAGLKECVAQYKMTNKTWNGQTQIRKDNKILVAVGPSGTSLSFDKGYSWKELDQQPFHSASFAGSIGFAVGAAGRVGKITRLSPVKKTRRRLRLD